MSQNDTALPSPIVTIQEGQIKGTVSEDVRGGKFYSFMGIPYAKPPVGDWRFKVTPLYH